MPAAPGTEVVLVDSAPPRSNDSDTGQAFMVAESDRGPIGAVLSRSLAEYVAARGPRVSYSYGHDAAEAFFRDGGTRLWSTRIVAPTAVTAFVDLEDADDPTLRVSAPGPGASYNGGTAGLAVIVETHAEVDDIPDGSFRLTITDDGDIVEVSPSFADKQAALDWSAAAQRTVVLSDLSGTGNPIAAVSADLATGDDNRDAITNTEITEAIARLNADLGGGQVLAPGYTATAVHTALLAHAQTAHRHALLDLPDDDDPDVVASAARAADTSTAARWGSAYWPWGVAPGVTQGTRRVIPYSAVQAGICARVDALGNPNQPAAGERHATSRWLLGLTQDVRSLTEAERATLNDAGVNLIRQFSPGAAPVTYGNRTLRLMATDALWYQASGSRTVMAVAARSNVVMRRFVHEQIDGKGRLLAQLAGELIGVLAELYDAGALYGATPEDAFAVDVGPAVNSPESLQAGELHAAVSVRVSPGAERVTLELVRVSILEGVA